MLNIMGGMDNATTGRVWYRDQELTRATVRELTRFRRDSVGFVFQFYNLVPNLTARENVMVATEISRNPLQVDEVLTMIGLGERIAKRDIVLFQPRGVGSIVMSGNLGSKSICSDGSPLQTD